MKATSWMLSLVRIAICGVLPSHIPGTRHHGSRPNYRVQICPCGKCCSLYVVLKRPEWSHFIISFVTTAGNLLIFFARDLLDKRISPELKKQLNCLYFVHRNRVMQ